MVTMNRFRPPRHRLLGDVAAVAISLGVGLPMLILDVEGKVGDLSLIDIGLLALGCVVLLWRWSQPLFVLVVVSVARFIAIPVTGTELALVVPVAFALYSAARLRPRRIVVPAALTIALATTSLILTFDEDESFAPEFIAEVATVLLPVAYADAVRSREERLAAAIEAETEARVQAERLRIARDLHDGVAHTLSVIAVQSGVAAHHLRDAPDDDPVRLALGRINTTGKRSLEDLRALLGVLRSTDDAPLRPTPDDPDDFGELVEVANAAGVTLTITTSGIFPPGVHDSTVVAIHRIAHEAITNVARHAGPVPATLELAHGDDAATLRVVNTTSERTTPTSPSTGVGVIGMRERAEALGGTLGTQALLGGGFEVLATIPYGSVDT